MLTRIWCARLGFYKKSDNSYNAALTNLISKISTSRATANGAHNYHFVWDV